MTNVICNTSPFQYLHQINQLRILPALAGKIIVPPAVVDELAAGRVAGVDLPDLAQLDWAMVQSPAGQSALPLISDLGAGAFSHEVFTRSVHPLPPFVVTPAWLRCEQRTGDNEGVKYDNHD